MKHLHPLLFVWLAAYMFACQQPDGSDQQWLIQAPAGNQPTTVNPGGTTVIPNGRLITPAGKTYKVAPHPYGLALSRDGNTAITANSGVAPLSITLCKDIFSDQPILQQIPEGVETDKGILASVFMGLAVAPDNERVYVAGGKENKIYVFRIEDGEKVDSIDCSYQSAEADYTDGYIGDLILSKDGKRLFAVDQIGFRMLIIDTEQKTILHHIPTGRYPFGIALSPDEQHAFVANVGMYQYRLIAGATKDNLTEIAQDRPIYAYLSEESEKGIDTDSLKVPGLGKPNVPESFSVWKIALHQETPQVTARINTGILIGEKLGDVPAVGGSSPNSIVATDQYVFVSNGNNDCISVIDMESDSLVQQLFLSPDKRLGHLRGLIPFGLALSPDQQRLYVAESGINAVGVIDIPSMKVVGHIPVGWFPSKLAVSPDGEKLVVANAKGYGSGPNGGPEFERSSSHPDRSYIGFLMNGSVTVLDVPSDDALAQTTQTVIENNFSFSPLTQEKVRARADNPIPLYPGQKTSSIKYIVFIAKENRTYDEVFGQLPNGDGEASMARFGRNVSFQNRAGTDSVINADVMVNHLALAERFAISDNFYVDADMSADGHNWLAGTFPNEWTETTSTAFYGGNRNSDMFSKAPGMLASTLFEAVPEDYNEAGSMWEHFERNNISFFSFGFGLMMPYTIRDQMFKYTGQKYIANHPIPAPLHSRISQCYATYNNSIPDQYRVDCFVKEVEEKWLSGKEEMPRVLTILLPNDHAAGDRPEDGYPFLESYMADNDLGLGRIVEYLSHTPYWKEMAIFVTEDDSQGGRDHVDAHRSLFMLISPYAKKNYIGHEHYSFGSIFKTFWHILGTPYLNQYDAGATDLSDLFTDTPDVTPYNALPVDERIFDPQKAFDPYDEEFNWQAFMEDAEIDDPEEMIRQSEEAEVRVK